MVDKSVAIKQDISNTILFYTIRISNQNASFKIDEAFCLNF